MLEIDNLKRRNRELEIQAICADETETRLSVPRLKPFIVRKRFVDGRNGIDSVSQDFLKYFGDIEVVPQGKTSIMTRSLENDIREKKVLEAFGDESGLEVTLDVILWVLRRTKAGKYVGLNQCHYNHFYARDGNGILRKVLLVYNFVRHAYGIRALPTGNSNMEGRIFSNV